MVCCYTSCCCWADAAETAVNLFFSPIIFNLISIYNINVNSTPNTEIKLTTTAVVVDLLGCVDDNEDDLPP